MSAARCARGTPIIPSGPDSCEAYTCLVQGTTHTRPDQAQLDRGGDGGLRYGWKRSTDPICETQERELIAAGKIKPDEARWQITDGVTGTPVEFHYGSVNWNDHLKKWLWLAVQAKGSGSFLGEVWLAQADSPIGPWHKAVRVLTHDRYTFYNPVQHPFFDQAGGRYICLEGTYAETFSGDLVITPLYDYNQIMYPCFAGASEIDSERYDDAVRNVAG